jgi:hypothetical protein
LRHISQKPVAGGGVLIQEVVIVIPIEANGRSRKQDVRRAFKPR